MFITRSQLAKRWAVCVRTIDRKREFGELPWVDVAQGRGARPCVRFRLADIEALESTLTKGPVTEALQEAR